MSPEKALQDEKLRSKALEALSTMKRAYATAIGATNCRDLNLGKLTEFLEVLAQEAEKGLGPQVLDSSARMRNLFARFTGIDLSVSTSGRNVTMTSFFQVLDLRLEDDPMELELFDLGVGTPVIVDLVEGDLGGIGEAEIHPGAIVSATLYSLPDEYGLTGKWRLWSTPELLEW